MLMTLRNNSSNHAILNCHTASEHLGMPFRISDQKAGSMKQEQLQEQQPVRPLHEDPTVCQHSVRQNSLGSCVPCVDNTSCNSTAFNVMVRTGPTTDKGYEVQ